MAEKDNLFMCQIVDGGARAVSMTGEHATAMIYHDDPRVALERAMEYAKAVTDGELHANLKKIWKDLSRG